MAAGTKQSLEERVAALEAAIAEPLRAYIPSWTPLTGKQEAELREQIAALAAEQPYKYRVIQQPPPLTPDEVRQLLRECVTIIKPGETLILRVPWKTTPTQVQELQDALTDGIEYTGAPFKVLVVPGDELTVAEAEALGEYEQAIQDHQERESRSPTVLQGRARASANFS